MKYNIPSNVIDIKYYNFKDISSKFMNCEITADKGSEFISLPYKFDDGNEVECLVPNEEQFISIIDSNNNPIYSICIVCSETFFKYFIPAFQYLGSKEVDDWQLRYKYVKFIIDLFKDPKSKGIFIEYASNSNNTDINNLLLSLDDGYIILNRSSLYFSTLPLLKTIVDDFNGGL